MNSATHAAIGATAVALFYPEIDAIAIGAIASQIPDVDTTESAIGAMFYPLARRLESSGHRGVTHSLLFCTVVSLVAIAIAYYYLVNVDYGIAVAIGLFSSVVADCFTKQGVQLFWPWRVWCVMGLNPNRRLKSGSLGEYWIILVCGLILVFSLKLGGLDGLSLGLPFNSTDIFLKYPTYCIKANVKAKLADQSIVSGDYLALSLNSFWRSGELLSSENATILAVRYELAGECGISVTNLSFNDESPTVLQQFVGTYSFVFGHVTADEPLSNGGKFTGEPIGQAIDIIGFSWLTGDLSVRTYRTLL